MKDVLTFCQFCGADIPAGSSFCPKCGKSTVPENVTPPQISRPVGITILAILQLIAGIFSLLAAIGIGVISTMGGMGNMSGMNSLPSFGPMTAAFGGLLAVFFAILAVFAFVISGALFSGKRWGRTLVIIISIIDLITGGVSVAGGNVAGIVGMILNLVILYYMWRPHVIAYFHRA